MEFTRRTGLLAAAAAAVLAVSACGGTADGEAAPGASSASASGAFPVTVEHIYGETTIEEQPQRVATISWVNADVALALDTVPVGMALDTWGANKNGSTDWKDAKLEELDAPIGSDQAPVQYDETDGVDFEAIAKLSPDVILAAYSGLTQEDYDKLSKIAPVVGPVAPNYTASWQDATTTIGKALGKSEQAAQVVEEVEGTVAEAAEANPALKGTTFIAGSISPQPPIYVYAGEDNRPRFLTALGMKQAPVVDQKAKKGEFYLEWAPENADQLKSDIFFTPFDTMSEAKIKADPLYGQIPAVKNGGLVGTADQQTILSISAASPLSVPWAVEHFVPEIAKAAEAVS